MHVPSRPIVTASKASRPRGGGSVTFVSSSSCATAVM
jgi:hypothetical protein